jgi:rRNA-processing protein FCF1
MKTKQRGILVDTSVLMDGRITSVASTGFIGGALVIPRSVIGELQLLADGSDSDKRARARRGLDIVSELQQAPSVEVEILQDGARADEGVDNRLITLAKRHNAAICTLDYNLNKVAVVEGIQVLNINELAQSLRMSHLPGEHITVELTSKGQDSHQAVGHLADGTMIVVEQASNRIGQSVDVEVIRSLQTAAGRMMFARVLDKALSPKPVTHAVKQSTTHHKRQPKAPQGRQAPRPRIESAQPTHTPRQAVTATPAPSQPATPSMRKSRRAPSSRDREAAFIKLVDNQQ